ncbi:hypothetical protein WH266_27515, partial [Pseudomonas sp. MYb330]
MDERHAGPCDVFAKYTIPVGASLLSIAKGQSTTLLNVSTPSRAGSHKGFCSASTLAQEKRHCIQPIKNGSSRITGKDALDLHEKELAIPVTVR